MLNAPAPSALPLPIHLPRVLPRIEHVRDADGSQRSGSSPTPLYFPHRPARRASHPPLPPLLRLAVRVRRLSTTPLQGSIAAHPRPGERPARADDAR